MPPLVFLGDEESPLGAGDERVEAFERLALEDFHASRGVDSIDRVEHEAPVSFHELLFHGVPLL